MANFSRGQTFGVTETVTNTKLHNLVDNASITNIVDADIAPGAAIQFSKLLASSIDGSLLTNLNNIASGAGKIPFANLSAPFGSTYVSLVSIPNSSLQPLTLASWVDGAAMRNIQSMPSLAGQFAWYSIVGSLASGGSIAFNGVDKFVGSNSPRYQVFTSNGTFIAPAGITKVFLTMVGGGAGGGGGFTGQGGGGAGGLIVNRPYNVTPGNSYAVVVGAGGGGGSSSGGNGDAGSNSTFDSAITANGGVANSSATGGSSGGNPNGSGATAGGQNLATGAGANGVSTTGGGGGGTPFGTGGTGGSGGAGTSASANTGGGGGGNGSGSNAGGSGGSGIVIVSY